MRGQRNNVAILLALKPNVRYNVEILNTLATYNTNLATQHNIIEHHNKTKWTIKT